MIVAGGSNCRMNDPNISTFTVSENIFRPFTAVMAMVLQSATHTSTVRSVYSVTGSIQDPNHILCINSNPTDSDAISWKISKSSNNNKKYEFTHRKSCPFCPVVSNSVVGIKSLSVIVLCVCSSFWWLYSTTFSISSLKPLWNHLCY